MFERAVEIISRRLAPLKSEAKVRAAVSEALGNCHLCGEPMEGHGYWNDGWRSSAVEMRNF
jgi:hypothetical protein